MWHREKLIGHARPGPNYAAEAIVPPERKQKETLAAGYVETEAAAGMVSKMTIDGDGFTKYETVKAPDAKL